MKCKNCNSKFNLIRETATGYLCQKCIGYTKLTGYQLYRIRSTDPTGIDAELDRRNRQAAPERRSRYQMVDTHRENNRWYIEDDGTIRDIPA